MIWGVIDVSDGAWVTVAILVAIDGVSTLKSWAPVPQATKELKLIIAMKRIRILMISQQNAERLWRRPPMLSDFYPTLVS
jgi:hypothetical protein